MLGKNVGMSSKDFQPFLPDHKEGYLELEQIRPGVVSCPFCGILIDMKESAPVKSCHEAIMIMSKDSWASVPICSCPGVWAVYSPKEGKWAARYNAKKSKGWSNPEGE